MIGGMDMTLQQLKYMIMVAEKGSITEAAKELFISQPSLSGAIKEVENEAKITIFNRCRAGVALTTEGMEFLGYARQVVQQMELLESRYIDNRPEKQRFCISTQHYMFAANAFVELVKQFGQDRYEFILNETQTFQIIMDVRNRFSDLGVLYLSRANENVLVKVFEEYNLKFYELFTAAPHVFLRKGHPLADRVFSYTCHGSQTSLGQDQDPLPTGNGLSSHGVVDGDQGNLHKGPDHANHRRQRGAGDDDHVRAGHLRRLDIQEEAVAVLDGKFPHFIGVIGQKIVPEIMYLHFLSHISLQLLVKGNRHGSDCVDQCDAFHVIPPAGGRIPGPGSAADVRWLPLPPVPYRGSGRSPYRMPRHIRIL